MQIITIGLIIIFNIVAIGSLYQAIGKNETKNKIAIVALSSILMYVVIYIIYGISSKGGEENIIEAARQLIVFTLLPINTLTIMSPIATQLRKLKQKEIEESKFRRKMLIYIIIAIVILIIECIYIKDIQTGIASLKPKAYNK